MSQAPPEVEARAASELPPAWREAADGSAQPGAAAVHGGFRLETWLDASLEQAAPEASDKVAAACVALFKRVIASQSQVLALCRARQASNPGLAGLPLVGTSDAEIAAAAAEGRLPATLAAAGLSGLTGAPPMSPGESAAQEQAARDAIVRPEVVASLARAMRRPHAHVSPALAGAMNAVLEGASNVYPILLLASSAEVEELANAYFKSIYTSQQGIGEVVDMLKRFKASAEARERDIFRCMLHNLFDEYRFFHKYPEKELRITGVLFGQVIQHGLVTGTTLGLALRYVLEALRKQPNTPANAKIYRFGLYALEQFRSRLPKWPQYCAHVVSIRHLRDSQPTFVAEIQAALASGQPAETSMMLVRTPPPAPCAAAGRIDAGGASPALCLPPPPYLQGTSSLVVGPDMGAGMALSPDGSVVSVSGDASTVSIPPEEATPATGGAGGAPPGLAGAAGGQRAAEGAATTAAAHAAPAPVRGPAASPQQLQAASLRGRIADLGADLTAALLALASGLPVPAVLPSAAAAAAVARDSEDSAAAIGAAAGAAGGAASGAGAAEERALDAPPPAMADRVNFIINNLTESTLDAKAAELVSFMKQAGVAQRAGRGKELRRATASPPPLSSQDYYPWLGAYLTKRVAAQPNYQLLYRAFCDRLRQRSLDAEVLRATLESIRRLLASDRIHADPRERTTLKNLGAWLGRVTLGRNKPLLFRDLNPKELLLEAYETGRLIAVVPFVAKVLESAADSVFRPPNPWTVALLSALRELYEVPDLKLNLKFEVEVLCKALAVEIKDIRQGAVLHKRRRPVLTSNPDFNLKAALSPENLPGVVAHASDSAAGGAGSAAGGPGAAGGVSIPGLLRLITISAFAPVLPPLPPGAGGADGATEDPGADRDEGGSARAALRGVVASAVDKSLREYLQPVVERSVTIATITARELITKDFAAEGDAEKVAAAARGFACDLAGSLALVTCQEPLKIAIGTQLRALLTAASPSGSAATALALLPVPFASLGEAAVTSMITAAVAETLTVASALVEKASIDRASKAVDEALAAAYAARRAAAAERIAASISGAPAPPPFVDAAVLSASGAKWPATLPESLRLRPGVGVSALQMRVYDGFAEFFQQQPGGQQGQQQLAGGSGAAQPGGAAAPQAAAANGSASSASSLAPPAAVAAFAAAGPDTATGGLGSGSGSVGSTSAQLAASLVGVAAYAPATAHPPLSPGAAMHEFNQLLERLTAAIRATAAASLQMTAASIGPQAIAGLPRDHELAAVIRDVRAVGLRLAPGTHREEVCLVQAQKLFRGLFELSSPPQTVLDALALQAYLAALVSLQELCTKLRKDLVSYLVYIPEDRRYTSDAVLLGLIRSALLHVPDFDAFVAKAMDGGRNVAALRLGMLVAQRAVVQDRLLAPSELPLTIEALVAIAGRAPGTVLAAGTAPPTGTALQLLQQLQPLLEAVRATAAAAAAAAVALSSAANGLHLGPAPPPLGLAVATGQTATQAMLTAASAAGTLALGATPMAPIVPPTATEAAYPETFRQQVLYLLETWVRICTEAAAGGANDKTYHQYLAVLSQQGVLSSDAATERFFRVMLDLCVQSCAATSKPHEGPPAGAAAGALPTPRTRLLYTGVDALSKLVVLLVKVRPCWPVGRRETRPPHPLSFSPLAQVADGVPAKVALLHRLLAIFARALLRDADDKGAGAAPEPPQTTPESAIRFDQRPHMRLLSNLLRDLHLQPLSVPAGADEATTAQIVAAAAEAAAFNAQVLAAFASVLYAVRPERVPGFAFAWLELISHRLLLPPLLQVSGQRGWPLAHRLIYAMLRFIYPALRRAEMNEGAHLFHRALLRVLLVLLHDAPEFLADYAPSFLEVLPPSCVQVGADGMLRGTGGGCLGERKAHLLPRRPPADAQPAALGGPPCRAPRGRLLADARHGQPPRVLRAAAHALEPGGRAAGDAARRDRRIRARAPPAPRSCAGHCA